LFLAALQSTAVYGTVGKPGGYRIDLAAPTTNIHSIGGAGPLSPHGYVLVL